MTIHEQLFLFLWSSHCSKNLFGFSYIHTNRKKGESREEMWATYVSICLTFTSSLHTFSIYMYTYVQKILRGRGEGGEGGRKRGGARERKGKKEKREEGRRHKRNVKSQTDIWALLTCHRQANVLDFRPCIFLVPTQVASCRRRTLHLHIWERQFTLIWDLICFLFSEKAGWIFLACTNNKMNSHCGSHFQLSDLLFINNEKKITTSKNNDNFSQDSFHLSMICHLFLHTYFFQQTFLMIINQMNSFIYSTKLFIRFASWSIFQVISEATGLEYREQDPILFLINE